MNNFVIPPLDISVPGKPSNYLKQSLKSFADITDIPVTLFNEKNEIVCEFLTNRKICGLFENYRICSSQCRNALDSAGQFTARLGEPYIFLCKAGLTNIAISLIAEGTFAGYIIAGPIVMGTLRDSTLNSFQQLNNLDEKMLSLAELFASNMKAFEPVQVSEIALLLYNSVIAASSVNKENYYTRLRNQYDKQNQINVDIQNYKKEQSSFEYPYELEQTLLQAILNGQVREASSLVRQMLNSFSIMEAGNLEPVKDKTLWLFAIVMRMTSDRQANLRQLLDADMDIINHLSDADNFDDLTDTAVHLIEIITGNMISSVYNGRSAIVSKALQFINMNYTERITLKMIEEELHVNASYFSTHFKNEMGIPFTQYVNNLRIKNACELLATTNLGIIDISITIGFDDQSYFSKVFKKETGMTPKQYRAAHSVTGRNP